MTDAQAKVIKDLAKQSYALENEGGLVHKTGHEALTSWYREAAECGDSELSSLLDNLDHDEWQEACLIYERAYSALVIG